VKFEFTAEQIAQMFQILKRLDWELSAHRAALETLGLPDRPEIAFALTSARIALKDPMSQKYDEALKSLGALPTEGERALKFAQLLAEWIPKSQKLI